MSEAILPCAVCGGKAVPVTVDPPFIDYISCPNKCVMQVVTDTTTAERWNQLQRWIADGRAVEWMQDNEMTAMFSSLGVRSVDISSDFRHPCAHQYHAPTLAEAVRKAQGDE